MCSSAHAADLKHPTFVASGCPTNRVPEESLMQILTREPRTEAEAFLAQERHIGLWAFISLLIAVNLTAVTLTLLAQ